MHECILNRYYKQDKLQQSIITKRHNPTNTYNTSKVFTSTTWSLFTYLSKSSWSASSRNPRGSQKPRGGWAPSSFSKAIFREEDIGLVETGAKADTPTREARTANTLNMIYTVVYATLTYERKLWSRNLQKRPCMPYDFVLHMYDAIEDGTCNEIFASSIPYKLAISVYYTITYFTTLHTLCSFHH